MMNDPKRLSHDLERVKKFTQMTIDQILTIVFGIPSDGFKNMEGNTQYQKAGGVDIIIISTDKGIEVKTNSFKNWNAYHDRGYVLVEIYRDRDKPEQGGALSNSKSIHFVHQFENETGDGIQEALIYNTKELQEYAMNAYKEGNYIKTYSHPDGIYDIKNINEETGEIYYTRNILIHEKDIQDFLYFHWKN